MITVSILLTALSVISYFTQGNGWLPLMVILGGTIGVPMGLLYPFPLLTKIFMVVGLALSLIAIIYGVKNSKVIIGQICAIAGIMAWSFIGLIGLGTGT